MTPSRRIAVVGGGIAGLTAAYTAAGAAREAGLPISITLFEASARLGGKIRTERASDGARLEFGPDSFLAAAKPAASELAHELGLELVAPGPLASRVMLFAGGRLRRLPDGLAMGIPTGITPLLRAVRDGVISPAAAARAALEPLMPRGRGSRGDDDPPVGRVMRARLGRSVADRLVTPLVSGVYGAPPDEIGMASAFPHLAGRRSLVLAMTKRPASSGPTFLAPREGMGSLVEALVARLEDACDIRPGTPMTSLRRNDSGAWVLEADGSEPHEADVVVVATPPRAAASLVARAAPAAAEPIATLRTSSSAVVFLRYPHGRIDRALDASGFLVAPGEDLSIAAATFLSAKWPHGGWGDPWIRAFFTDRTMLQDASDDTLVERAASDLRRSLGTRGDPIDSVVHRWPEGLPIQEPGYRVRVARALEALPPSLRLAGAAYLGSGVPDAIRSGRDATEM